MNEVNKWYLVKDLAPYIATGDLAEDINALCERYFSPKGKEYPILCIAIYSDRPLMNPKISSGIRVSISYKQKSKDWWQSNGAFVPLQLIGALKSLINEAVSKIKE